MDVFDVVIVGGGSAGCVLASRLSEDDQRTVLLLEAGEAYQPDQYPEALTNINGNTVQPGFIWGYSSILGKPAHPFPSFAAKLLGGTSAINGAISRRARPSDFARWQKHGLEDWSWEHAVTAFKALENTPTGADEWHGRTGVWPIRQPELDKVNPVSQLFVQAAINIGYKWIDDFNGSDQHGVGLEPRNMEDGVRFNVGTEYLSESVRSRKNLTIRATSQVDRLLFSGSQVTGMLLVGGETIPASKIILSSGVYGTPAILLRSGIGPKEDLSALGIRMVADLPVGTRLQEQPMYALSFQLKPEAKVDPPNGSVAVWTSSSGSVGEELDLQLTAFFQPDVDSSGAQIHALHIWASVVLPISTGYVRIKNADPLATPEIHYNLLADHADRERQREIIRIARRIASSEPLASWIDKELDPGSEFQSDAELDSAIDAKGAIYFHATSTAPMGTNPASSVSDGTGQVHGVANLFVADASSFPEMVSPPVHLTVIMLAERIAASIRTSA